jgi:Ca-activated chloride channel family protein
MSEIARISGGTTYTATTEQELRAIYTKLTRQIGYETRRVDISHSWLIASTLLTALGPGLAVRIRGRIP